MRKLIIGLGVLLLSFAGLSLAAVEDIKVSGDIHSEYFTRDLSLGQTDVADNDHDSFFSQTRLRFDADLTEGASATLRLIDERGWGEDPTNDDIEVDLAYIELKKFFYGPLTLIVGRQNLRYGNGFIVGDPDTSQGKITGSTNATGLPAIVQDLSLRKSFDAIRAILDYTPWTIDLVYAQVDEADTDDRSDDELLMGINAAYSWTEYGDVAEFYFFKGDNTPQSTASDANDRVYVLGSRTLVNLSESLTLGAEGAWQFGDYRASATDHDHISAWAGQFVSEYRFLNDYKPKLNLIFTFVSGDRGETGERYEAWNPLWKSQPTPELMNILLSTSNRQIINLDGSLMPREDLLLGFRYARGWLVEKFTTTAIQNAIGPLAGNVYYIENSKKHLGDEVDLYAVYDLKENVQLNLSGAWLFPGTVFTDRNDNHCYSVRAGVTLNF